MQVYANEKCWDLNRLFEYCYGYDVHLVAIGLVLNVFFGVEATVYFALFALRFAANYFVFRYWGFFSGLAYCCDHGVVKLY